MSYPDDLTNLTLMETTRGRDDDDDPVRCFTLNDDDGRIVVELQLTPDGLAVSSSSFTLDDSIGHYVVFRSP